MRLLHVSDLHCGTPSVPEQVAALERIVERAPFDVIVISGDLSQRTRTREFTRARDVIRRAERFAPVFVIPGNHDVAWWRAPFGVGSYHAMFARYRRFIAEDVEPVLRVEGATLVALNSAHGIQPYTLTTRLRDPSVVGAIRREQWAHARETFRSAPSGDLRVLVIHHNLLRGRVSERWGLANRARGVEEAGATGADLVLCGHDHEARIEQVSAGGGRFVVSTTNTLTDRVRGGAAAQFHAIASDATSIVVTPWVWSDAAQTFTPAATPSSFSR